MQHAEFNFTIQTWSLSHLLKKIKWSRLKDLKQQHITLRPSDTISRSQRLFKALGLQRTTVRAVIHARRKPGTVLSLPTSPTSDRKIRRFGSGRVEVGLTEVMTKNLGRDMKESLTLLGSGAGRLYMALTHRSSSWCAELPARVFLSPAPSAMLVLMPCDESDFRGYTYEMRRACFCVVTCAVYALALCESWRAEHGFSRVSGVAGVVRRGRVETSSHCGDLWQVTQHRFDVSQLLRVFTGSPTGRSSVNFIPWLLS